MTQAFNYIAAILVVFFGLWLFSGDDHQYPASATTSVVAEATNDNYAVVRPRYRQNSEMLMDNTGDKDVASNSRQVAAFNSQHASSILPSTIIHTHEITSSADIESSTGDEKFSEADSVDESTNDADWLTGLMSKARNMGDRIININLSGSAATGSNSGQALTNDATGDELNNENSMLPQPTESETLVENKVDCPSMMYMGGNAYGRNMLIKMGCDVQ
jgi:hypothetical protein